MNENNSTKDELNLLLSKIEPYFLNTHSDISDIRKFLECTGLIDDELFRGISRKFFTFWWKLWYLVKELGEIDNRMRHNPYRKIQNINQFESFLDQFKKIFKELKANIESLTPTTRLDEYVLNYCLDEIDSELEL